MSGDGADQEAQPRAPRDGSQAHAPGGLVRRHFLGAAAAGAAGLALAAATGCDAPSGTSPGTGPDGLTAERARSGSPDWRLRAPGPPDAVEGYTDKVSVRPGEDVGLYVSTTAPGLRVSAYRVGWYGGAQARLVWRSPWVAGHRQRRPRLLPGTRTVRADWQRTLAVRTTGWPPGAYLLRLDADHGHQRYVPLVVRSATAAGRTVLMHAVTTWQAYNRWGGYNLYAGEDGAYGSRSLAVSFDRPYDANGAAMAGSGDHGRDHGMDARTRTFVTRTTENLLRAFAAGPAAKNRPAPRNNVAAVYGT